METKSVDKLVSELESNIGKTLTFSIASQLATIEYRNTIEKVSADNFNDQTHIVITFIDSTSLFIEINVVTKLYFGTHESYKNPLVVIEQNESSVVINE